MSNRPSENSIVYLAHIMRIGANIFTPGILANCAYLFFSSAPHFHCPLLARNGTLYWSLLSLSDQSVGLCFLDLFQGPARRSRVMPCGFTIK